MKTSLNPTRIWQALLVSISVLSLAAICSAQQSPTTGTSIKIKNFGQMDERFFRGAQPNEKDRGRGQRAPKEKVD
jgi:hypothetical protein